MALAHHDPPHLTTLHQSTSHHQPTTPSHLITLHYLAPRSPSLTAELKMPMALAHHDRQFFLRVSKVALTQTRANPLTTHTHTHTRTHTYIYTAWPYNHTPYNHSLILHYLFNYFLLQVAVEQGLKPYVLHRRRRHALKVTP